MISIRHLQKKYENVTPLSDINAEIEKGEVISIIGPSGTGKSTLLRCLNRLETPTSGEIWLDGENTMEKDYDLAKMRRKMGMVFQSFNLFEHKTVIENIMMPMRDLLKTDRQSAYDKAISLLEMVGLESCALQYPAMLSGGQKQRVAICRTLAMDPAIILFDEPTSALDPTMVGEVESVIHLLKKQGYTMLIVTHDVRFASAVSTRVFYMDQGIIYEEGTPEQIFGNPQRERTISFIRQVRSYTSHIAYGHFDFISVTNDIVSMGQKLRWSEKTGNAVAMLFEELTMRSLVPHMGKNLNADFTLSYVGADKSISFTFTYDGDGYNAYTAIDELVMPFIKSIVAGVNYEYVDGMNRLEINFNRF